MFSNWERILRDNKNVREEFTNITYITFFSSFPSYDRNFVLAQTNHLDTLRRHSRYHKFYENVYIKISISCRIRCGYETILLSNNDSLLSSLNRSCILYSRSWFFILHIDPACLWNVLHYWVKISKNNWKLKEKYYFLHQNFFALIKTRACRHMLEEIGKKNNANFNLTLNKTEDNDYKTALNCLRRHLQVIKWVLMILYNRYWNEIISTVSIFLCLLELCSDSRFCRFAALIESTFTKIFLISVNLNVIGGSISGMQVYINLYFVFYQWIKNHRNSITFNIHKNNSFSNKCIIFGILDIWNISSQYLIEKIRDSLKISWKKLNLYYRWWWI